MRPLTSRDDDHKDFDLSNYSHYMLPTDGLERADYLLGAIGVALTAGFAAAWLSSVSVSVAAGAGSLVATVAIADAFRRPP